MDADMHKTITPNDIISFENSSLALRAVKLMGTAVDPTTKTLASQEEFVTVRDFVITETIITTASRSGAIANITEDEFLQARKKDDQMIISVRDHKTAYCHGPAKVVLSLTVYGWLHTYYMHFRPLVCTKTKSDPHVFLSHNCGPYWDG